MAKFATFNCNSIRARLPIISDWLDRVSPDALFLQETKVQDKDFPGHVFEAKGYHAAFLGQKSYNGVAIITKRPLDQIRYGLYNDANQEARFMSAIIQGLSLVNVYVPQGFSTGSEKFEYKLRWLEDLLSHVRENFDPGLPLLIAGDFNVALEPVDVYDPEGLRGSVGFHPDEQSIMTRLLSWGLVDIFRKYEPEGGHYTFWDYRIPNAFKRKMGWRIDYILASRPLAEQSESAWIDSAPRLLAKPSDHTFMVAQFNIDF